MRTMSSKNTRSGFSAHLARASPISPKCNRTRRDREGRVPRPVDLARSEYQLWSAQIYLRYPTALTPSVCESRQGRESLHVRLQRVEPFPGTGTQFPLLDRVGIESSSPKRR